MGTSRGLPGLLVTLVGSGALAAVCAGAPSEAREAVRPGPGSADQDPAPFERLVVPAREVARPLPAAGLAGSPPAALTLLVDFVSLHAMLVPSGATEVAFPAPSDCAYIGLSLYLQVMEWDPGATWDYSFSRGLELRLGL